MQSLISCTVEVIDLQFSSGLTPIFEQVNFTLEPGALLMVYGGNGSGKTSLLRVLGGFARATGGSIQHSYTQKKWCSGLPLGQTGWLGHKSGLKDELTTYQNLFLWKQNKTDILQALEKVGLATFRTQLAADLSAGEKRRLALARLILVDQPLWLLDEPSANMDVDGKELIEDLLTKHVKRGGNAIIASHDTLFPNAPVHVIELHKVSPLC